MNSPADETPSAASVNAALALQKRLRGLSAEDRVRVQHLLETRTASGYALLAEALRRCGVKRVFGVTGVPVDAVFPECAKRGIRPPDRRRD